MTNEQTTIRFDAHDQWQNNGGRIEGRNAYTSEAEVIAVVGDVNHQTAEDTACARLITAAPQMLDALRVAADLLRENRHRFPKSIAHRDRFSLENTNAAICKAIHLAEQA